MQDEKNELVRKMKEVSHKQELIRWIMQACASCPPARSQGKAMACNRKRSQCHSKRVKKWLKALEELEKIQKQEVN